MRVLKIVAAITCVVMGGCGRDAQIEARSRDTSTTVATPTTSNLGTSTTLSQSSTSQTTEVTQSPPARDTNGRLILPSWTRGEVLPGSLARDVGIEGDAAAGCVWLTTGGSRTGVGIWPTGTTAAFNPLRIYDKDGRVVWTEGELRDTSGPVKEQSPRVPPQCAAATENMVQYVAFE